jgi:hypothetical protein
MLLSQAFSVLSFALLTVFGLHSLGGPRCYNENMGMEVSRPERNDPGVKSHMLTERNPAIARSKLEGIPKSNP